VDFSQIRKADMTQEKEITLHSQQLQSGFKTVDFFASLVADRKFLIGVTYSTPAQAVKVLKKDMTIVSQTKLTIDGAVFVAFGKNGNIVVGSGSAPPKLVEMDGSALKRDCAWGEINETGWSTCNQETCIQTAARPVKVAAANGGAQCGEADAKRSCKAGLCATKQDQHCAGMNMVYSQAALPPICMASCEITYVNTGKDLNMCKNLKPEPRYACVFWGLVQINSYM
jgi:hypothetical protein